MSAQQRRPSQLHAALDNLERALWVPTDDDIDPDKVIDAALAVLDAAGRKNPRRHTDDDEPTERRGRGPSRNARMLDAGWQAYAREEGHYDGPDY